MSSTHSTRRAIRALAGMATIASAAFSLLVARTAQATPDFPDVVKTTVGATRAPDCIICHNNELGGLGTATTAFGTYMRARGVVPYDENSLRNALAAAAAEKHDSDGDGIDDIDALKMGLNPNGTSNEPPIGYGCFGRIAPRPAAAGDESAAALAVGLAAFGMIVVRRKRGRR